MKRHLAFLLLVILTMTLISCSQRGRYPDPSEISVVPKYLFLRVGESQTLKGTVIPEGSDINCYWTVLTEHWNCVDIAEDGTNATVTAVNKGSAFVSLKSSIERGPSGYCQIYVENKVVSEPIDLGLSVKWASCNVGASVPEEYGNWYAWGETIPYNHDVWPRSLRDDNNNIVFAVKENGFTYESYKFTKEGFSDAYHILKYQCEDGITDGLWYNVAGEFIGDGKNRLEKQDDVAACEWSGKWRMPTYDEMDELVTKCRWLFTSMNGVYGYEITGSTGKSIFLPLGGQIDRGIVNDIKDKMGYYWSSSLTSPYEQRTFNAIALIACPAYASYNGRESINVLYTPRANGCLIRPVTD